MPNRQRKTKWTWQDGSKNREVKLFTKRRSLIWSAWADAEGGAPMFEDGIAQSFSVFLENGAPEGINPPPDVLAELTDAVQAYGDEANGSAKGRGLFKWFR